jgi:hypothetical protein
MADLIHELQAEDENRQKEQGKWKVLHVDVLIEGLKAHWEQHKHQQQVPKRYDYAWLAVLKWDGIRRVARWLYSGHTAEPTVLCGMIRRFPSDEVHSGRKL